MKELIDKIKKLGVVVEKSVTLSSGQQSDFYCDIKKVYGHPDIFEELVNQISVKISSKDFSCLASSGYGGLPLASVLALKNKKFLTLVRENKKGYGRETFIDGYIPTKTDKVLIIDDVFTTGGSIEKIANVLRSETKVNNLEAFVVTRRGGGVISIPVDYLLDIEDLK